MSHSMTAALGFLGEHNSAAATVRSEKEVAPEEEANFTASDEHLQGDDNAAAGRQG